MAVNVLGKLRKAFVSTDGLIDAADVQNNDTGQSGVLSGSNDLQAALNRLDGTGVGASIFRFTGAYSAQDSNRAEWFGNKQLVRMRCIDSGIGTSGSGTVPFDLPGTTALNNAFDILNSLGLQERITFIIEYTGASKDTFIIRPRPPADGSQIGGVTSITVASGISAQLEITRTSGTISEYVFQSIGQIAGGGETFLDSVKLINPATAVWDASASGALPSSGVVKGNAYKIVNAPADGSGRFDEVMYADDWAVWFGESFSSWNATPHQWFVISAHDVRRITALERDFLTDVQETTSSDRNTVVRGADYAIDSAHGEIRLKIYDTLGDYSAADLNTTGDIDEFTDTSDATGVLAIRLAGTQASLADVLPTLYVYVEDGSGNFTRLLNLANDFTHEGDFGAESDYVSIESIDYTANDTIRIYVGSVLKRYNSPNLDVFESNLSDQVQVKLNSRESWADVADVLFSNATVRDIHVADRVVYDTGYSRGIDWRDMAQSTTINANRYLDSELSISVDAVAFSVAGFGTNLQKLIGVQLQRNDAAPGDAAQIEIGTRGTGDPFLRINSSFEIEINSLVNGADTWIPMRDGTGNVTIAAGSNNFLLFEILPALSGSTPYEIVPVLFDGTNYKQLNNVAYTPTNNHNGNQWGFSRSVNQKGQVLRFSVINSPGYMTHSQLESLIRQHSADKWNFGFARLIEGSTTKDVDFKTRLSESGNDIVNVSTGTAAPTIIPSFIGQMFVDSTNKNVYIATDISAISDWIQVNN